jgi:hypothetical protein
MSRPAELDRLEAELAELEDAHDFDNGTDARIEDLIDRKERCT